jgi:uncharacterized protein (DUF2236 family)
LEPREREEFYQEFKLLGELLGIPRDRFPDMYGDFNAYLEQMMSPAGPVRVGTRALELGAQILRPRLRLLPGPVMVPLNVITTGLLPPALRDQYGLLWGPRQQRAYRLAVTTLPKVIAITPPLIRMWPRPGRSVVMTAGGRATTS